MPNIRLAASDERHYLTLCVNPWVTTGVLTLQIGSTVCYGANGLSFDISPTAEPVFGLDFCLIEAEDVDRRCRGSKRVPYPNEQTRNRAIDTLRQTWKGCLEPVAPDFCRLIQAVILEVLV